MQPVWPRGDKMWLWLGVLLTLSLCASVEGQQENPFTINSIRMESLPAWTVPNGQNLTLQCIVDISTTSEVRPQHLVRFYKDDIMIYNTSSAKDTESFFIPQARMYHSGKYKCTVTLSNKEKTTKEYGVLVKGLPSPKVMLDKKEVVEGGVVTVNCSVEEERAPINFKIEKLLMDTKTVKQTRQKMSTNQNFMVIEFPIEEQDHIVLFRCQAMIYSGFQVETSAATRSELVTVRESFSIPKFHISPEGMITEGDQLLIKCTIQVTYQAPEFPEIIILKDKNIVAHSSHGSEATYSVMAMVEHNGNYTCKVESSRIAKLSSILVNITELFSKPKLESSTTLLDEGERLSLWCTIPGAPPGNFTIQKGNVTIAQAQNLTLVTSEWDSGPYTCTATISNVVKRSNVVRITVCEMLSQPKIFHDTSLEVIKGQTVRIHCQSVNGTGPITYRLLKARKVLQSHQTHSNGPVVFKDNPTKDAEYQCIADNCHSHPEMISEVLKVKVVAPVDEVKLTIQMNGEVESGQDMVLRCLVNEASPPITYNFYKENEDRPFYYTTINNTQATWHKPQASKEQEGQYYCTAFNRANRARIVPQSNVLPVRVFLAPWKKGLIAVVVIGVIIATLVLGARCYFLKKAKAKQIPVEMSRPAVPLLNSNNEKIASDPNIEANSHYGYNEDVGNHAIKPVNENKELLDLDVEYTEVEVTSPEPHRALESKGTETVYSEIRKADPDFMENRYSRTESSLDGT
ncbi:platelet endothelial cell adhesion molecule isoform X1 [Echinops telfairi]|uniref:Platelet endothelial cell adhesion molecule isoform X1 n=2 Tax=Echinops telfairi TaxID=9371 RepID=A0AC55DV38_ECHTE|nr:platelet endothelial cell adhesion molecule isoform X1 [Echinops telfairi]XP_045155607.1 platelet endothelial cell adhesion molecule isoform X1 [Echinops telfairi]